ncbi:MAG TPA: glutaredoxin family protein [Myxococcaceae bacterium]|nr:glutaredoxin family protein [Myxococcaceae bacterium]
MKVRLYTKPACPLCDKAKAVLATVRERIPFDLEEVDIRSDPELFERYKFDIPVIHIEGQKAFKHRVDPMLFEQRLRRELAGTSDAKADAGE